MKASHLRIPIVIRATILKWLTFESYENMDMCRIGDKKMGVQKA